MVDERHLREQVERCRRLARSIGDDGVRQSLTDLAGEYEERLQRLRRETRSFAPPKSA